MKILVAYGTSHGSTAGIATRIGGRLRERGAEALVVDLRALPRRFDLSPFDAVVLGGRVWGNRYPRRVALLARRNLAALKARPSAFFSVCLWNVSRIPAHRSAALEVPLRFLSRLGWVPGRVEVFAGALALTRYRFGPFGGSLMRWIWKKDLGPLEPGRDHVFTDWAQVDAFAAEVFRIALPRARMAPGEPAAAPI